MLFLNLQKILRIILSIMIASSALNTGYAENLWRPMVAGDIAGRALDVSGLGWIGHVGIGYGDNIGKPAQRIVEVLNEDPVIQFNSLADFISRSKYWGSRHGLGDYAEGTRKVITEAFHQSFWCPQYTKFIPFIIGEGYIDHNGEHIPTKCGQFRCDTFVAWLFYNAGYPQIMDNNVMMPRAVWYAFPRSNGDGQKNADENIQTPQLSEKDKYFSELTVKKINNLSFEKFSQMVFVKKSEETPFYIATVWKFVKDKNIRPTKRAALINVLFHSSEQDILSRFIEMLKTETNEEIQEALISGTMFYYQNHWEQVKSSGDYEALKFFYHDLLNKKIPKRALSSILRGYLDFHSADEIANDEVFMLTYEQYLKDMEPRMALGLYYELSFKSPQFESIALSSMIKMLRQYHRADLDGMFFGIIKLNYKHYKNSKSVQIIKDYIVAVKDKYSQPSNQLNDDPYVGLAKQELDSLDNALKK